VPTQRRKEGGIVSIKEQLKETLGHMTDKNQELAVFANNVVFGISRYKNGIIDEKTRVLLQQGEELCTVLRRGADMFRKPHPEPYSIAKSDLNSLLTFEFLSEFFKENEQNVPFSLDNLVQKATEEQSVLEKLLLPERLTEDINKRVDECQDFFASLGSIFVRLANDGLRQREKSERIHYV
jgi:hypothetical protein